MNFKHALAALALGFGVLPSAQAVLITFEGQANTIYNAPISRSGFDFGNPVGQEQHFHEIDSNGFSLISNGTGILLNDRDSQIFAAVTGGGVFNATSIDVASSGGLNLGSGLGLTIEGFLNNVSVGVINVAFGINTPFQTVNLSSLGTVDRLVFDGIQGGFELDNAVFNAGPRQVPEPATLALLGLGLGALGMRRRKQ